MEIHNIMGWQREHNVLRLQLEKGTAKVCFQDEDIMRIIYTAGDVFEEDESNILASKIDELYFDLVDNGKSLTLTTEKIKVELYLNTFGFKVIDKEKNEVISSRKGFLTVEEKTKTVRLKLGDEEKIYGLGQDPMANLNQRDKERRMWHQWGSNSRSGNGGIPFMLSSKGYGILLNSSRPSRFAIGKAEVAQFNRMGEIMAPSPWNWEDTSGGNNADTSSIILEGGDLDLFIIVRSKLDDIIEGYSRLTGFAPLLPKWAYGFMQCKNRYRSQEELLHAARVIRKNKIPCDVLIIDWLWFREFGDLEWDKRYWPDVEGMFQELTQMGFKVMQAQHPFLAEGGLMYKSFEEAGYMNKVPEGKRYTFDHTNPEARKAWWEKIKPLYEQGIRGYWTDMGELEEHFPGTMSYLGEREKVHNIYSLLWAKGLYEGQRNDFNERAFTLARTAYAGMQRYGAGLWSGDIDASWEVLKSQVVVGQEVCLSGMPYWTTDIGGFITNMDFTPELFVRWLQWGVFCPLFRTHGTKPGNEPWSFGKQAEKIISKFIELRYRLLPYIYSCARKITEEGRPMMRAMAMDYPHDPEAVEKVQQYMFGPNILVAPVTDKGVRRQTVYLPEGQWYDFWTDEIYSGNTNVEVSAPLERIPLFIRGGSIIPMSYPKDYIEGNVEKDITIHIYPGNNSSFELYDDDGLTYEYEKGNYFKTMIEYNNSKDRRIKIYPTHLPDNVNGERNYNIMIHGTDKIQRVTINNDICRLWKYDESKRILEISCDNISLDSTLEINIIDSQTSGGGNPGEGLENIKLFVDTDMENNGEVTVNLTVWTNKIFSDLALNAVLKVPEGWTIRKSDRSAHDINAYWKLNINNEDMQSSKIYSGASLKWTVKPVGEALPVIADGVIEVEYVKNYDCLGKIYLPVSWGSGLLTRWSILGSFQNKDNEGFDYCYEPEINGNKPYYIYDSKTLSWIRDSENEFNCFGYIDLRRIGSYDIGESINGVSYCRCRVWSGEEREAYFEISAESGIKVWFNRHEVLSSKEIIIDRLIPQVIKIKSGWNDLLVKSTVFCEKPYSGREYGFNMRLLDEKGEVIKELLYMA